MQTIISIQQAIKTSEKLRQEGKTIVLVGGCFDILHIGHIEFLKAAKDQGDILFVLLESDESLATLKGPKRPINSQNDRAVILSALRFVDYVVLLKQKMGNDDYDDLTKNIKPAIIATTKGDAQRLHKDRQAKLVGAKLVDVLDRISNKSTSRLINLLVEPEQL